MEIEMEWNYLNSPIYSIRDAPKDSIGFVYIIEYTDGKKYIGKKNLYSNKLVSSIDSFKKTLPIKVTEKKVNSGKGFRITKYEAIFESDWKKYQGSAKECKNKICKNKTILAFAYSKLHLTYLEVKYQMYYNVLEDNTFINDNILGKFYKGKLYEETK